MFAALASSVLLGVAAPQESTSPQDASNTQDLTALTSAAREIAEASSYRFKADARIHPRMLAQNKAAGHQKHGIVTQPERAAYAKENPEVGSVELDGEFVRSQPIHFENGDLEAFRLGEKLVYQSSDGSWKLSPPGVGHQGSDATDRDLALWAACVVPAPHELLRDLENNVLDLTREEEEGGLLSSDKILYRGQLKQERLAECMNALGEGLTCSILITTTAEGDIETVELNAVPEGSPAPSATEDAPTQGLSLRFELMDRNDDIEVDVPVEGQELLLS